MKLIVFCFLCALAFSADSARILGVFHVPSSSHFVIGETILKELANKGHDVTIASTFKSKEKNLNYREIYLDGVNEVVDGVRAEFFDAVTTNPLIVLQKLSGYINAVADKTIRSNGLQKLLKSEEKFDIVIIDPFGNEAHFGLANAFNAHLVLVCTAGSSWVNNYAGNVAPYSFVPQGMTSYTDKMTLMERGINALVYILFEINNMFLIRPFQKSLYEEFFIGAPPLEETIKNSSLILINSHVVFETPRPYVPNMIPISGVHIQEPKLLPKDIESFISSAKEGVIFFSLGSNMHSSLLPKEKQQAILKTFAKFPQKILWKFEDENLPNKPENVKIAKWFPQTDILAHPNVKLFITHGGLLSSTEAVFRGVPIVGIPVYGDQYANIKNLVDSGYGQSVFLDKLTEESFTAAIKEVLDNPSYHENIKKSSALLRDQPDRPLDRAIFWIEHVLRHNGAKHLRSASLDISLYQYLLLDVLAVVVAVFSISGWILCFVIRKLCCCSKKKDKETTKAKKGKPKRE